MAKTPEPRAPEKQEVRRGGVQTGSAEAVTIAGNQDAAPNGVRKEKGKDEQREDKTKRRVAEVMMQQMAETVKRKMAVRLRMRTQVT